MLDDFAIRPMSGTDLKIDPLLSSLAKLSTVVALPSAVHSVRTTPNQPENVHIVCATPDEARRVKAWADQGNKLDKFIGSIAILEVATGYISVYQPATERVVWQVSQLLLPVLRGQRCRVFSETGEEPDYETAPELLFS